MKKAKIFAGLLATISGIYSANASSGERLYLYHNNSIVYSTPAEAVDSVAWEDGGRVALYGQGELVYSSAIADVDSMSSECYLPKADILDVVFNADGTATDVSPMGNNVEMFNTDGALQTYYNEDYDRYAAHFGNGWASRPAKGYYKVSYKGNTTFKSALADGHTLECVVMADVVNNSEAKFFSSHAAGGTGLMICNKDGGRQYNSFTFLPNVSETGGSTWRWANSNVQPTPGQYYHLVAVYDKEGKNAKIYVNGELKCETAAPGNYRHPDGDTTDASHWFGIGCDPGGNVGEQSWQGDVVLARIYDRPLNAYEAEALYDALTEEEVENPELPVVEVPKAKLLDIVFNADGTATDVSPMGNKVSTIASDKLYTYYSPAFGGYVAHFDNGWAQKASGYYRVDYKGNNEFKSALEDGHSLECIVMANEVNNSEAKFFSSHAAGGTGLMICNKNDGRQYNSFTFLPNVSETGGSSWRWANSNVQPVPGRYYHLVGVYDKEAKKARIYVNGELKAESDAPGNYRHPDGNNSDASHWFGIGCDPGGDIGEQSWQGDVALARIYDRALSPEEAANLWTVAKAGIKYVEPELVSGVRLYNLPVKAGKTYPVYATGFEAGDVLEMTGNNNKNVEITTSLSGNCMTITLPQDFTSGIYCLRLHRGDKVQTLGNAKLNVVASMPKGAEIIAHRGHWNAEGAVQNSRASLQAAIDINAYGSETDVWLTTDGHLVINHDRTLSGVTLCESTFNQCKDLTLGNGEKLPELFEFIRMVKGATESKTRLVIEIKDTGSPSLDERTTQAIVNEVEKEGMDGSEKIKYISFSRKSCEKVIALRPEAEVAFICANANNALTPAQLHDLGYHGFDYEKGLLRNNLGWISQAHELGMIVNVWTVSSDTDIIEMMNYGVDFITSDNPVVALEIKAHYDANCD